MPSESILVLDRGAPRHRIASFRDAMACGDPALGGAVRHSYRDYPATGFVNLLLRCDDGDPPHHLLSEIDRAVYLVRPTAQVEIDLHSGTLRLVASGVSLEEGRVRSWHPVVEIRADLGAFLRGIELIGNDLQWFQARNGCVGAPSLLVRQQPVS
jgi:predicted Zn-dependent protease